jgi:hypothetical protein
MAYGETELIWVEVNGKMKLMCQNGERDRIKNDG